MKWKSLFAAALSAAFAVPAALAQETAGGGIPSGRVISVNFAGADSGDLSGPLPDTEEIFGLVPVPGSAWVDLHGATAGNEISGIQEITSAYGSEETFEAATLTYSAKNMYGLATNSGILKTWLGDGTGAQISVTNIPFENYAVIVYFATNNGDSFKPVTVNNTKYIGTAAGSKEVTDTGNATWGSPQPSDIALGTNALRVNGLSGDLSIVGASSDGTGGARGCIAGFQIVEVFPSISVNFAGDASGTYSVPIPKTSEAYGLFPVPGSEWENGFTGSGTIQVSSAYGSSETFSSTLSYKSKNIWHNTDSYDTLLQTYLDDGTDTTNNISGASISMDNVPFTEYAVIVYCAGGNNAFLPVTVNGKTYTYQDNSTVEGSANFGSSSVTTPTLGQNALCVTGLTDAALTVQGQSGGENTARGGIAAIQIICTGEIKTSSDPVPETSVISLNFGSNYGSVPQTADNTYGLIPVPGYTWTNISGANGSQTVTVASGKPLTTKPTVAYDSNLTYFYNQATDPFLKGYLDDGQRSEGVGASVTVSNLPFWAYDVVVYAGLGDNNSVARPVRINDTLYTWDSVRGASIATDDATAAYGGIQPTAQYGRNALRVKGLSDYEYKLTVQGLPRSGSQRGGIAAIQIVERKVIQNDNIGDLDPDSDTPVHILLTNQISGDLTLPRDAILDLSMYWLYGATPPITGTLKVNEGTQIRLPKGASWTIAGAISGTLADNAVIVDGSLATGVEVSGGTISADATYVWTGSGKNDLWSNQYNWSSHTVPDAEADVTIPLDANGAVTIKLPSGAVAKSVTITGPESGSPTLALTSAEGETGSLTVSGRMLTTGNVTVTQNANITVDGKSTMVFPSGAPQAYPYPGAFHVEGAGAAYNVVGGTLSVPTVPEMASGTDIEKTAGGFVTVCGGASLSVGGGDAEAVLSVYRCSMSWPSGGVSRDGTVTVRPSGVLEVAYQSNFASGLTLETEGGTIRAKSGRVTVSYRGGYAPTSSLTLSAPEGATLTLSAQSSTNALLTGNAPVIIDGPGEVAFVGTIDPATYTGEISVEDGTLSIGERRPKLSVVSGTKVLITPTTDELAEGAISFATSMTEEPTGDTFTVSGVKEKITPSVVDGVLTLKWESAMPTLATSGDWSAFNWTVGETTGQAAPTSGVVVLDGTAEGGINVTLDTELTGMESILVLGNVTLETTDTQTTIPACVTPAEGATLTVGAVRFASGWTLPSGATLKVTDTTTSLSGLTLNGVVELAFSDTTETPATYSAPVSFLGGLTVSGSDVSIKDVKLLGDAETRLTGDNVSLTFSGTSFYTRTTLINEGTGNKLLNIQNLNGEILANDGTLTLEVALVLNGETSTEENPVYVQNVAPEFKGLTIAEGATVTFTGVGTGGQFAVTGAGTLDMGTFRKQLAGRDGTLVKNLRVTATDDEQKAGEIRFLVQGSPALPEGFQVVVTPAEGAAAWEPTWGLNGQNLVITNTATVVSTISGTGSKKWSVATDWVGGVLPTAGEVVIEGGTSGNGLIVYLDTAIPEGITSITVRGKVSLQTSAAQPTLPLDILHVEEGTTLGLEFFGNNVTQDISSLNVNGGLLLSGDNVTLTAGTISGTLAISPATHNGKSDTVRISGDNSTLNLTSVAEQTGVAVTGPGNTLNIDTFSRGSILTLVPNTEGKSTSLTLNSCANLGGVDIQSGTTLKLAASWNGGELHAKGAGTLDMSAITETAKRPTLGRYDGTSVNLPSNLIVTATAEEIEARQIVFTLDAEADIGTTFPTATVIADPEWESTEWVVEQRRTLTLRNTTPVPVSPSLPDGAELSAEATAALNTAAEQAGITGEYAVAITTGGATVQVTTAEAATQLQEVLECFTGLTLKATTESGNTVTVVYDFGVVGIKRNTTDNGWVVTAKVQGENAAQAGFAEGNAYTLKVKVPGETGSERIVNVTTVDEANIGSGTVELKVPDTALEVGGLTLDDGFTLGVSVSRNAQQL